MNLRVCETAGTDPKAFYICGPTASGKSALALEMARKLDGEIVNADAFQLYRGLEIVSAAPSAAERAQVPHHLYGVLAPTEAADAGSYMRPRQTRHRGNPIPRQNAHRHRRLRPLSEIPHPRPRAAAHRRCRHSAPNSTPARSKISSRNSSISIPMEAARTALQNRRFVSRALEICLLTGQKASELRDQWETKTRDISGQFARHRHPAQPPGPPCPHRPAHPRHVRWRRDRGSRRAGQAFPRTVKKPSASARSARCWRAKSTAPPARNSSTPPPANTRSARKPGSAARSG